ncbi:unnamed protein product [Psylliodes chrysocephalus]|uniref:Uncharacterized protein n=1 Tax=Psylliodes chrysocephalus TaxID=3402493 RepID=A0A9P0G8K7_9CUCU|nr:unnamed protein product [Psylliodes chrysocephala]
MGKDLKVYDWKSLVEIYYKKTTSCHFKFNEAKRFILNKSTQLNVLVRGETSYNTDLNNGKLVVKKGAKLRSIALPDNTNGSTFDMTKHFGEKWDTMAECTFNKNVILGNTVEVTAHNRRAEDMEDHGTEDEFCEGHADEQLADHV